MPALGAVTAIALTAAMVWQSRSGRVAMTLRLVPVALLLGTSSALAFDTSKLIQFGTLPFDDLTPVIAKSARLQQEINQALSEGNKEHRVVCLGMRFPGPWKNLGGVRVSPYTCDFGAKWLQIHATVRITDRHGRAFETITAKAMKNATNVSETNLNWEWTTECGTAAYLRLVCRRLGTRPGRAGHRRGCQGRCKSVAALSRLHRRPAAGRIFQHLRYPTCSLVSLT